MLARLIRILGDTRGATAIEYGLILALVVLALLVALQGFAGRTITMWNNVSNRVNQAS